MTSSRKTRAPILQVQSRLSGEVMAANTLKRRLRSELADLIPQRSETVQPTLWLKASAPPFSLHFAARDTATLADVDQFLREVWMECCGHLSQFVVRHKDARRIYTAGPEESSDVWLTEDPFFLSQPPDRQQTMLEETRRNQLVERPLMVTVKEALADVKALEYEYDLGSTTRCKLEVMDTLALPWPEHKVLRLLARSVKPEWACGLTGEPAEYVCTSWESWDEQRGGPLRLSEQGLKQHLRKRPDDEDFIFRLSNSPRDPGCGYEEQPHDEDRYVWR